MAFTPQVPWDSEEAHQGTRSYLGGGSSTGTQAGGTYGQETAPGNYAAGTPSDDGPSTGVIMTRRSTEWLTGGYNQCGHEPLPTRACVLIFCYVHLHIQQALQAQSLFFGSLKHNDWLAKATAVR